MMLRHESARYNRLDILMAQYPAGIAQTMFSKCLARIVLIAASLSPAPSDAQESTVRMKSAIEKALPGILRGAASYPEHRGCFSCHHQAQPLMTLTAARARGFKVDPDAVRSIVDFSVRSFGDEEKLERIRRGISHRTSVIGYMLTAMAAVDHPPDATTSALVQYMLVHEHPDGGWRDSLQRHRARVARSP